MPPRRDGNVVSWASIVDEATLAQAQRTARLPIVHGHVALMPDAHLGIGATVGSVIPTRGAIIPAAVGVDIGCGMVAAETTLTSRDLPEDLRPLLDRISAAIPAGMGQSHGSRADVSPWAAFVAEHGLPSGTRLDAKQETTAAVQFGTLGSGNHFLEVCLDERDRVWVMLHSGSRGVGNQLAQRHIARAKGALREALTTLEDPDLAYVVAGTEAFDRYVADVRWAQAYAAGNRRQMVAVALRLLGEAVGRSALEPTLVVNCHHNYASLEQHDGVEVWVTRKGAILARAGDLGIVPGSMGARSYIVRGKGNPLAYHSSAHGAGRAMSRRAARKRYRPEDLAAAMAGRTWLADKAGKLVDELPAAYKDIDQVMADSADLVEVVHELHQVLNYKGT
ncbi:MAG: RtcB family protein [Actinomycetota bacterium]|nr:RtcB family protein [Actinomycetota bacterium]